MSPMKHQQLINLINRLDLPAERVQVLGEDMRAIRCGMATTWIMNLIAHLFGLIGGPKLVYGVTDPSGK